MEDFLEVWEKEELSKTLASTQQAERLSKGVFWHTLTKELLINAIPREVFLLLLLLLSGAWWGITMAVLPNSYATGSVSSTSTTSSISVGGLVGSNDGSITNSYATGSVSSTSTSTFYYSPSVGGLVGSNSGGFGISCAS